MRVQPLNPSQVREAIDMWRACFPEDDEAFAAWFVNNRSEPGGILGIWEDKALVANLHQIPYTLKVRGQAVDSVCLSGVATDTRYRKHGYASRLIEHAFADMRAKGRSISLLYPVRYGFYERLGYAICGDHVKYALTPQLLPEQGVDGYRMELVSNDESVRRVLALVYTRAMERYNGVVLRDERQWALRLQEHDLQDGKICIVHGPDGPCGYWLVSREGDKLTVDETASVRYTALHAGLHGLRDLAADGIERIDMTLPSDWRLYLLIPELRGLAQLEPRDMLRIVDAQRLFAQLQANVPGEVTVCITDRQAPWNAGTWRLSAQDGRFSLLPTDRTPLIRMDIGTLTQIVLGFISPGQAVQLRRMTPGTPEEMAVLERWFPSEACFTFEMY